MFHFHMHIIPRYKDDGQVIGWEPHTSRSQSTGTTGREDWTGNPLNKNESLNMSKSTTEKMIIRNKQ